MCLFLAFLFLFQFILNVKNIHQFRKDLIFIYLLNVYHLISIILTLCYSDLERQALGQYKDLASSVCIIDLGLVFLGTE